MTRFNSSMVQLKHTENQIIYLKLVEFQFLNGSIKAYGDVHNLLAVCSVSIPQWFN